MEVLGILLCVVDKQLTARMYFHTGDLNIQIDLRTAHSQWHALSTMSPSSIFGTIQWQLQKAHSSGANMRSALNQNCECRILHQTFLAYYPSISSRHSISRHSSVSRADEVQCRKTRHRSQGQLLKIKCRSPTRRIECWSDQCSYVSNSDCKQINEHIKPGIDAANADVKSRNQSFTS